jgi:uncharacterized protein (TIGR02145 family)
MKKVFKFLEICFIAALMTTSEGCNKDSEIITTDHELSILMAHDSAIMPSLTTAEITSITPTSATSGGTITYDGGENIIAKGIAWSTTPEWYIYSDDEKIYGNGPGSGSFISYMSNLRPGTTYFVKAFAANSAGMAFGPTLSFTTPETNLSSSYDSVYDIDGNIYRTIKIGTQIWMAENLKTTRYNNGISIPNITDNTAWSYKNNGSYSWYDNNALSYKETYGALYNWYAATNSNNVCPTGWHVPSASEWTTLVEFLGGPDVAGGKVKEAGIDHWSFPNSCADNGSGLTGLPGGVRRADGLFVNLSLIAVWWTTTISDDGGLPITAYTNAFIPNLYLPDYLTMNMGCSIRCIKD